MEDEDRLMSMTSEMLSQIRMLISPVANKVANTLARAIIQRIDDSSGLQRVQIGVLSGESLDSAERIQNYGFSSTPLEGSEAVVLFIAGDRAHPVVVSVDDPRHRPTGGSPGESVMYDSDGDYVRLRGGAVTVRAGSEVRLGSDSASDPVARKSDIDAIFNAISSAVIVATDGGASLKTTIVSNWPSSVGSPSVKAE